MSFYIGKIKLPVLEATIQVSKERESENVPIINGKTISILGKEGLLNIYYSSFFPKQYGSYCDVTINQLKAPNKYKQILEELRDGENYFLVRITELKINKYCKIKSFNFNIEDGIGDISYSLHLEEYNKAIISKSIYNSPIAISVTKDSAAVSGTVVGQSNTELIGTPRETKTVIPQFYKVKEGDNLYVIARKFNMIAKDLYYDNKNILGMSYEVKAGMELKIRGTADNSNQKILKLER